MCMIIFRKNKYLILFFNFNKIQKKAGKSFELLKILKSLTDAFRFKYLFLIY
jgi:hypothetical protein